MKVKVIFMLWPGAPRAWEPALLRLAGLSSFPAEAAPTPPECGAKVKTESV
jgi:hypothetical protein